MKFHFLKESAVLCALAGIICAGGTAAYFTSFDKAENRAAVGRNDTEIAEEFPDPPDIGEEENPQYRKKVWISNTSSGENGFAVDCFVRAAVSYSNHDIGRAVSLLGLDTENWVYSESDGYYYYRKVLREGESTTPLFTGLSIETERIDPLYRPLIRDFQINVYEESVQAGEFQDYQSAWRFYGSPASRG